MDTVVFENTLQAYLIVIAIIIGGIVFIRLFKRTLLAWLKRIVQKSTSTFDDFLVEGIGNAFLPLLYFGVVYFTLKSLILPDWLNRALDIAGMFLWVFIITRLIIFSTPY